MSNLNKIYSGPSPWQVKAAIAGAAASSYMVAIDLDNQAGAGPYPHSKKSSGVRIFGVTGSQTQTDAGDAWTSQLMVVTEIDGTDATLCPIGVLVLDTIGTIPTANLGLQIEYGLPLVVKNALIAGWVGTPITSTAVNTGQTLLDAAGNAVTPAVGDVLLALESTGPSGTASASRAISYVTF